MNFDYILKALNQAQDLIERANDSQMPDEMQEQLNKMSDDLYWIMSEIEDIEKQGNK